MFLSDLHQQILDALRHGDLDQFQIGADLSTAPFVVRAELRYLRRNRLVKEDWERRRIVWGLTDRGWSIVLENDQLSLGS